MPAVAQRYEIVESLAPRARCRALVVSWHQPCTPTHQSLPRDRKSTRLNSSHSQISYAVFCLKKKNKTDGSFAACNIALDIKTTSIPTAECGRIKASELSSHCIERQRSTRITQISVLRITSMR